MALRMVAPRASETLEQLQEAAVTDNEALALKTIKTHVWLSMGAGLIPVPLLDWMAVSGVQLKMLASLSKTYGIPFRESSGKATIGSLGGFVLPHAMAFGWMGSVLKAVPLVGVLAGAPAMAIFAGAYTWALGKVFVQHFESGGTFLNFDAEKVKEYFRAQFDEGHKVAAAMKKEQKLAAQT